MKKIAVLGSGAIGGMLAAYLARGGEDVTVIPAFRRESAERISREGLFVSGPCGDFHVNPKACFLDDLTPDDRFDYVFLGLKSNDFRTAAEKLKPYLKLDGCVVTLQNGINEELLTEVLGQHRVVAGISFAGGRQLNATHFADHDGTYIIGELDGRILPRTEEIAAILRHARPTEISQHIRQHQWEKLGTVALHVPCCTTAGEYMMEVFQNPLAQRMFRLLALEVLEVAEADGCPNLVIQGRTKEMWQNQPYSPPAFSGGQPEPGSTEAPGFPEKAVDAYTSDMKKHLPLEIDFTNGAVVRFGKRYGIPTPANEAIITAVHEIEAGTETAGNALLERLLAALE